MAKDYKKETLGGSGGYLKPGSLNYDLIINILVGNRRTLSGLSHIKGIKLDPYQYTKRIGAENEWYTSGENAQTLSYNFYDYAPLVF